MMLILAGVLVVALAVVTAQAIALRHARAIERRYLLLLENLPQMAVTLFDRELRFQVVGGPALRDAGMSAADVVGKRLREVVSGEQGDMLERYYQAAVGGEPHEFEYRSVRDDRDYWLRVVPVRSGGEIVGGMAISQDISERKGAERERARAEGSRRMTVDAMVDAYVAIDGDGRVCDWNESAVRVFGHTREAAMGADAKKLIVPESDHHEFDELMARYLGPDRTGRPLSLRAERTALHRDGHVFPVELAAATLEHAGVLSLHTFMHDITERKRNAAELEAHAADVETLAEAIGALARSTDSGQAREAICRAAAEIGKADLAVLLEPEPGGALLRSTAALDGAPGDRGAGQLGGTGPGTAAAVALASGQSVFRERIDGPTDAGQSLAASAFWVPVLRDGTPIAVIAVGWLEPLLRLEPRVERMMGLVAAEAEVAVERMALLDRLERIARTDDLTGLPNRRAWDQELGRELARARRSHLPLVIAMIDIDDFKYFNDRRGHQAGDRMLKEAAGAWRAVLRETDLLARYGGDEFAVALPGCGSDEAVDLVDRLRAVTPRGESCSAGLALWDGTESPDELVGRADGALYRAKQEGRDKTSFR